MGSRARSRRDRGWRVGRGPGHPRVVESRSSSIPGRDRVRPGRAQPRALGCLHDSGARALIPTAVSVRALGAARTGVLATRRRIGQRGVRGRGARPDRHSLRLSPGPECCRLRGGRRGEHHAPAMPALYRVEPSGHGRDGYGGAGLRRRALALSHGCARRRPAPADTTVRTRAAVWSRPARALPKRGPARSRPGGARLERPGIGAWRPRVGLVRHRPRRGDDGAGPLCGPHLRHDLRNRVSLLGAVLVFLTRQDVFFLLCLHGAGSLGPATGRCPQRGLLPDARFPPGLPPVVTADGAGRCRPCLPVRQASRPSGVRVRRALLGPHAWPLFRLLLSEPPIHGTTRAVRGARRRHRRRRRATAHP
jgi:hypothetical protein